MTASNADVRIDQIVDTLCEPEGDHDESTVSFYADWEGYEFVPDNPRVLHDTPGTVITEYELSRIMDNPFENTSEFAPEPIIEDTTDFTLERISQIYGYIYIVENSTTSAELELDYLAKGDYGSSALYHIANIIGTRLNPERAKIVGEVDGSPIYQLILYRYVDHPELFEYGVIQSHIYLYHVEEIEE